MDYRELNTAYNRKTRADEATPKQMYQLVLFGFMNGRFTIVIWRGLPDAMFSQCYSDEQFEAHLQEAIDVFSADGRCVLGVADLI
jgi:hypothetical protein